MNTDIYKSIDYSKLNEHLNSLSNKNKENEICNFQPKDIDEHDTGRAQKLKSAYGDNTIVKPEPQAETIILPD